MLGTKRGLELRRTEFVKRFEKDLVKLIKRYGLQADIIGGQFLSPGIRYEMKQIIKKHESDVY